MNIYFIGIGGSGISALANLALDCNYNIWGSDNQESLNTCWLEKEGVEIDFKQNGEFLQKINSEKGLDLVIYSAGVPKDSQEMLMASKLGIKTKKRDYFINLLTKDKNLELIAIAGTHGKTTTSGMAVWAFKQLNIHISYAIGSNISFGKSAKYDPDSKYFVYEADEFDRNFLHFNPESSLITSIDFDHGDIYKDYQDYFSAFAKFMEQSETSFIFKRDLDKLNLNYPKVIHSFSTDSSEILKLNGKHNRENAFLVLQNLKHIFPKIDEQKIIQALNNFPGTQRRMEKLSEKIYTDYAHHPKEIEATIQGAKESYEKIAVVYQPHQNARQISIVDGYKNAFYGAEKVYWLETYLTREPENQKLLSPQELTKEIESPRIIHSQMNSELEAKIFQDIKEGVVILFMGAGSIDKWARELSLKTSNFKNS